MKIVILKGSPRQNGNSNWLAGQFAKGAVEAGHEIVEFDCAKHKVGGCLACNACGMNGPCVQQDDFIPLREQLLEADAIVLATPIYYFGVSAQLKNRYRPILFHKCHYRRQKVGLYRYDGQPRYACR